MQSWLVQVAVRQNRRAVPASRGFQNVEELSQANLNSCLFICLSSVCRRPRGDVSVLSSQPYFHIPEPGTACFPYENVAEEKGGTEDGKGSGRFCKRERFSGCGAAHPEPDCATRIQTAQMTPSLGTFPRKQAFMEQQGVGDLPP